MSVRSILLRLLLSVGLILNGSGYAVASAHMQMDDSMQAGSMQAGTSSTLVASAALAAETPCPTHHLMGMQSMSTESPTVHGAANTTSLKSGHPSPDCCKSGACRCACVHQCQAAVPAVAFQLAVIEKVGNVRPMQSGHESPAVPHLIRPPIG